MSLESIFSYNKKLTKKRSIDLLSMSKEEGKTQVKKEETKEDESTLEDEFEEYLKKDIPESQPEG
jgi:hypothetical protein